jgi:phage baseplate assembly protein W
MNVDYPFHFDAERRTGQDADDEHVRDLIEQLLFTNPGERVNRPDFGCGLLRRVFEPNGPELAAVEFTVSASLQYWLGDLITVTQLTVSNVESTLLVAVNYQLLPSQLPRTAVLRSLLAGSAA